MSWDDSYGPDLFGRSPVLTFSLVDRFIGPTWGDLATEEAVSRRVEYRRERSLANFLSGERIPSLFGVGDSGTGSLLLDLVWIGDKTYSLGQMVVLGEVKMDPGDGETAVLLTCSLAGSFLEGIMVRILEERLNGREKLLLDATLASSPTSPSSVTCGVCILRA